jgi:hypothetical protein
MINFSDVERIKLKGKVDVFLSKGPTPEEGKWNNQDLKVVLQSYKRAGDMAIPKYKEGVLLRYVETCGRVVTYQDAVVTDVDSRLVNPNSTVTTQKNFAAAALEEEPPALDPALVPTHVHGVIINNETEDRIAASAAILALDPAARTGRPQDDTEEDTTLPPALTRATAAPAWDEDDTALGPANSALYSRPRPMDKTLEDVHLPSFEVESEVESSDEESVFDMMGL